MKNKRFTVIVHETEGYSDYVLLVRVLAPTAADAWDKVAARLEDDDNASVKNVIAGWHRGIFGQG